MFNMDDFTCFLDTIERIHRIITTSKEVGIYVTSKRESLFLHNQLCHSFITSGMSHCTPI